MQEYKMPYREQNSNKGTFGKVLNFCGSGNYIGAAYLASKSSLKVGAGYSALATEQRIIDSISGTLPEVVYLSPRQGLNQINDFTTVLLGCGIGTSRKSYRLVNTVIDKTPTQTPMVIDADGLNLLAKMNKSLKKENLIITPHPIEAARLLKVSAQDVLTDLETAAKTLSEKYGCITVLKSHNTVICNKTQTFINKHGNSALAKAGSGDVLAGIIAGLLAQKMQPYEAAVLGTYLHSRAGEIASEDLSEYSVLANDLINYLPKAIKEVL